MIDDLISDAEHRMGKSVEALKAALAKLRTGRAHPGLLDQVMVDYYGTPTVLNQVANINVEDARTLSVSPWEKNMIAPIEKAIMQSDLGLNPMSAGAIIRVPLPPLTEERRKSLVKVVKDDAEKARVSVRNVRREVNTDLKSLEKSKDITEDDVRKAGDRIQKITDQYIAKLDLVAAEKEKDLMQV